MAVNSPVKSAATETTRTRISHYLLRREDVGARGATKQHLRIHNPSNQSRHSWGTKDCLDGFAGAIGRRVTALEGAPMNNSPKITK